MEETKINNIKSMQWIIEPTKLSEISRVFIGGWGGGGVYQSAITKEHR